MLNRREIGDISEYELSEILSEAKRLYPDKLIL